MDSDEWLGQLTGDLEREGMEDKKVRHMDGHMGYEL